MYKTLIQIYEKNIEDQYKSDPSEWMKQNCSTIEEAKDIADILFEAIEIDGFDNEDILVRITVMNDDDEYVDSDEIEYYTRIIRTNTPSEYILWGNKVPHIFAIDRENSKIVEKIRRVTQMNIITKIRKTVTKISGVQVGDQIEFELKGFGAFTATAQQITSRGIMFLMDDCVAKHRMNEQWTNEGGYEKSEMYKWINEELTPAFKETFGEHFIEVTLPTYGQMFGHDEWYEKAIEPDNDEQFPLMKKRKNRVADFKDDYCWYWLKNATKKSVSSDYFALVGDDGLAYFADASGGLGVRPVFLIK